MTVHLLNLPRLCHMTHPLQKELHDVRKTFQIRCSGSAVNSHRSAHISKTSYQPSTWSYDFIQSLKTKPTDGIYQQRLKKLEDEVRGMIKIESNADIWAVLETIDDIERLGLGYRFENDIRKALHRFSSLKCYECNAMTSAGESLHATALRFRLLRQHGFVISPNVFMTFLDKKGNFQTRFFQDVKGLLSLYKATYFAFEDERLLDEAEAFARIQIGGLSRDIGKIILEEMDHELELPLQYRVQRLEARWYIESYNEREDKNRALLELAMLDFNMVQSEFLEDLKDLTKWWMDTGLTNQLNFARDRLVECFIWSIGMISQPHLRNCRKGLTKIAAYITVIDDIYDVYGSMDELELFTNAVDRWDVNAVQDLPNYMKLCFLSLYNTVNEMAYYTLKEQGENAIPYLTKAWADMCKAFLQEAKWNQNSCRPTFGDYLKNAWVSVSGVVLLVHAYFLAKQCITKQALDCLENYHDLLYWPSIVFRLCNDLGTSSAEIERGKSINSISCYMHDNGVSEEVARERIRELIGKAWKNMNKLQFENAPFEKSFVEIAKNLARISHCTYQHGDGHGAPDAKSRKRVLALVIEPIVLNQSQLTTF